MTIDRMKESYVATITNCDDIRLLENGFIPGTQIQIYRKVYGIISIAVRGTIIALRKEEYDKIIVE
jgi:Fe2+ transport system protein FeoA